MGLRLSVREAAWQRTVATVAAAMPGIIPVVKGNGYGFGRRTLMHFAAGLADRIAVGTVYEAADVPTDRTALVLTPHLDPLPLDLPSSAVLTVGSVTHVAALRSHGWAGAVAVKLQSSMRRYGARTEELGAVLAAIASARFAVDSYALHLPLVGEPRDRIAEIDDWMPHLDPLVPLAISHVDTAAWADVRERHSDKSLWVRVGTALWHADKSQVHLSADVLDVHAVTGGAAAGYRGAVVPVDGHLVLVAAGSTHGVRALDDGRSPFHFERQRLALLEAPHMHSSMLFVPDGVPHPHVGDRVDVQRPLISTIIDELEWVRD